MVVAVESYRRLLGASAALLMALVLILATATFGAENPGSSAADKPTRFTYTGSVQTLGIPADAGSFTVTLQGGKGGAGKTEGSNTSVGGRGDAFSTDVQLPENIGKLYIYVGGNGQDGSSFEGGDGGWNGGGLGG